MAPPQLGDRADSAAPGVDLSIVMPVFNEHATVEASIVWANSRISQEAVVRRSILGRHCHIGRSATLDEGVVLGDKSSVTDYSRL